LRYRVKLALVILAVILLAAALIAAQRLMRPAVIDQNTAVRVLESVRSPYFLPQYLAENLGFFKEEHLQVTISATSPEAIRAALADGRADIVICGMQKVIFDPDAKAPRPVVFAAAAARDGSLLLARKGKDTEDFQWQKMKHKAIIGGSHDDSSEIALEDVLRHYNLPPYREVTIYNNIPDSLRMGAFRTGTGNYIQLLEPDASLAELRGFGHVVASVGSATGDMVVTAYASLPGYIESDPVVIQGFTNAIYKAQLWLNQHSAAEAAEAAAPSFPNLDKTILQRSIERYQSLGVWNCSPLLSRESYERFQSAAKDAGEIAAAIPYESTVVTGFARQAVETVTYVRANEQPKKKTFFNIFSW